MMFDEFEPFEISKTFNLFVDELRVWNIICCLRLTWISAPQSVL
jgi:hypothetical protein